MIYTEYSVVGDEKRAKISWEIGDKALEMTAGQRESGQYLRSKNGR